MAPATSNQLLNRLEETIHQIPFAFVPTNSELNLYLGGKIKFNANSYDLPLFFSHVYILLFYFDIDFSSNTQKHKISGLNLYLEKT